ncbi:glycoside hydrolase family 65 protein [Plantactinospora sonchi]|uniref:Glycosyl hydrolase family 65 protein n=1 Tax=Plantactinospora sonchi TaxID=1544735 RepID=A0ABU7RLG4_9ACTN
MTRHRPTPQVPRPRTAPASDDPDTWLVREDPVSAEELSDLESIFALGNGWLGVRGVLDEGGTSGLPSTYLNSCYEERELTYPEQGYAFPERNQVLIGVPDGTPLRLFVDDQPLDVRDDRPDRHERVLDLRAGTLSRTLHERAPHGRTPSSAPVRVTWTRLVSLVEPAVLGIRCEVTALDRTARVRLHSDLRANPELGDADGDDPRAPTTLDRPLVAEHRVVDRAGGLLAHRTRTSGQRVAAAVTHLVETVTSDDDREEAPAEARIAVAAESDLIRTIVETELAPGQRLVLTKLVAYAHSADQPPAEAGRPHDGDRKTGGGPVRPHDGNGTGGGPVRAELVAAARAALDRAVERGWAGLLADQRAYLDAYWADADVLVDGDPQLQQAVRFALFHLVQAAARTGDRPIPAKGLTGNGYDGHTMWDAEIFVLRVLTYLRPELAAGPLRWRHDTLDQARERARTLRLAGAAFPWRTIGGRECSGYWPAGTAALHVNADIAVAVLRHATATGDLGFLRDTGLELLVETARLWSRVGHYDDAGGFHLHGVTGPDEYTALVNDNLFTNLMARKNLLGAVETACRFPQRARELGVEPAELNAWRAAAEAMHLPYDPKRGVHEQCAGFTALPEWDFAGTDAAEYPLLLHYPYLELYRRQVVKQADVVLAMQDCGSAFTAEEKARNFAYYERRTVRDSSLSACGQAVLAAELGHLDLAYALLAESALHDLHSLGDQTRDGLHVAALAGVWIALVVGFGGFRDEDGGPAFSPRLPPALHRMRFALRWQGRRIQVTVEPDEVTYLLAADGPDGLELRHHGRPVTLVPGRAVTVPLPPAPDPGPEPASPPGRRPRRRNSQAPVEPVTAAPAAARRDPRGNRPGRR